jgi:hypothetical protein
VGANSDAKFNSTTFFVDQVFGQLNPNRLIVIPILLYYKWSMNMQERARLAGHLAWRKRAIVAGLRTHSWVTKDFYELLFGVIFLFCLF